MDEQAAEVLSPEQAAEILNTLTPLQQKAVGLYVNHVIGAEREQFKTFLQAQLTEQEERLNKEFLAELQKRTAAADDEPDDDLYTSRDEVTQQAEFERHRQLFQQENEAPAQPQLSVAEVEQISERVALSVFQRLATQPNQVHMPPYVNPSPLQPQLVTPNVARRVAYVPTLPFVRR